MIHAFRFQNYYLALDVESGAVHSMDEQAYEVVRALEEGRPLESLPYPKEEVGEIVAELNSLHDAGAFEAEELVPPEGTGGQVIKAMCMHMAHDCNLRCKYCFADTGEFHGARMLMPEKVAYAALDLLIAHSGKRHNLEVDLFGGEPLMNWDVVKKTVAYGRELEKKHDKRINFTITTNCVALDDEKIDFINREMHNVVLSLDGRREIHDALRPTANGKGSFDLIAPRAQELVRRRGDKEHYVRGTFTNRNLDFTNDVKALREMGFEQISLEPVVLPDESPYAIRAEHVETVLAEYDTLASFLLSERKAGRWFNFFHFMVDLAGGPCLKKRVSGCGAGAEYVAVSPDGDISPVTSSWARRNGRWAASFPGSSIRGCSRTFFPATSSQSRNAAPVGQSIFAAAVVRQTLGNTTAISASHIGLPANLKRSARNARLAFLPLSGKADHAALPAFH